MEELINERTTLSFSGLVRGIESGKIRIPHFQRKFAWTLEDAAKLFDSIFKNVPIGNIVVWESEQTLEYERNIGMFDFPENESVRSYVLDGQQRTTSLFATLKGLSIDGKDFKKLYVDLDISPREYSFENIVHFSKKEETEQNMFPVYKLWSADFQEYLLDVDSTAHKINAGHYAAILNGTSFAVEKIITNEIPIAVSIFHAINMGGVKLTTSDIMGCILFDNEKQWFFHEKTESFQLETKSRGFELKKEFQLQIAALILNSRITNESIYSIDKDELIDNWESIKQSVFLSIDFLKSNYNLSEKKHLFSGYLLHLLSFFYYKNNNRAATITQKKKLEKLIIYIGMTNRYSSATATRVSKDTGIIEEIVCDRTLPDEVVMGRFTSEEDRADLLKMSQFKNLNSMKRFPLFIYSVLAMKDPLSFATGMRVLSSGVERSNRPHKHHIFPKSTYGPAADSIFNIMLLDAETNMRIGNRKPSEYILEYQENEEFKTIMESHFIGEEELLAIEQDDLEGFKHSRMLKIMQFMNNYFE